MHKLNLLCFLLHIFVGLTLLLNIEDTYVEKLGAEG